MNQQYNFSDAIRESPYIFVIGVAGDSGSGKTTFSRAITEIFGEELVVTITVDDYHIYDRNTRTEMGITPLLLSANNLDLLENHITDLKSGKKIVKPVYDHSSGTFSNPETIVPKKFVIIEGLHPYATKELSALYDYTIFVDPDNEVKYDWKIRRDIGKRHYDRASLLKEMDIRKADYTRYVQPQRKTADALIEIFYSSYGKEEGELRNVYQVVLSMPAQEYCFEDIELNIDLCDLFKKSTHNFSLSCTSHQLDGKMTRGLIVDGELIHDTIHKIERQIENQTKVGPINIFHNQNHITGTDLIRLILSWQIINRRIAISHRVIDKPHT